MRIPARDHVPFLVPAVETARRVEDLQSALREQGAALAWIEHPTDRLYFSGSAQDGVLLIPAAEEPRFFVRKSRGRAAVESPWEVAAFPGRRNLLEHARELLGAAGRIGLALDVTPASTWLWLQRELALALPVDLTAVIRTLRATKSAWEIEQIRSAAEQATTVYAEIERHLRAGITELELTGAIEGRMRALGHGGTVRVRRTGADISMGTVVSGDSGLYPTSFNGCVGGEGPSPASASGAGWKRVVAGETVMLDIVTSHNGYHADTTRTFVVGSEVPEAARAAHGFCLEVLAFIEARLRPGARCAEIFGATRRFVEQRGEPEGFMGFGENRVRFFGHGVGLELDELPVLAEKIDTELRAGMILAVEPKAFLPGIGPVGVENTYVIGAKGCASLCPTELDLRAIATLPLNS